MAEPRSPSEEDLFAARYLTIMRASAPAEIARLAALLARGGTPLDATTLVQQAISLREAAEAEVICRKKEIVSGASGFLLRGLQHYLKNMGDAEAERHSEVIEEVIRSEDREMERLMEEELYGIIHVPDRGHEREKFVSHLKQSTGQDLPSHPCSVEAVVQWSINGLEADEWSVVENAFLDYLCICRSQAILYEENNDIAAARVAIERLQRHLSKGGLADTERQKCQSAIEHNRHIVDRAEFATKFVPGGRIPEDLKQEATSQYFLQWKGNLRQNETQHLKNLATLVRDFRPFWKEHCRYYMDLGKAAARQAKELKANRIKAGQARAAQKEIEKWKTFCVGFKNWSKGKPLNETLIGSFPSLKGVPPDKGRQLLSTMLTAERGSPTTRKSLEKTLAAVKIRLPQAAAEECLAILFPDKTVQNKV